MYVSNYLLVTLSLFKKRFQFGLIDIYYLHDKCSTIVSVHAFVVCVKETNKELFMNGKNYRVFVRHQLNDGHLLAYM